METRIEVIGAIRSRYREAPKKDKSRMLDEFVAIVGCHRKHAVRLLGQGEDVSTRADPDVSDESWVRGHLSTTSRCLQRSSPFRLGTWRQARV